MLRTFVVQKKLLTKKRTFHGQNYEKNIRTEPVS